MSCFKRDITLCSYRFVATIVTTTSLKYARRVLPRQRHAMARYYARYTTRAQPRERAIDAAAAATFRHD